MILDNLDTIIAFAVVMLAVSVIITILTQMVAALLHLRGKNLKWGLSVLLRTMDSRLADKADDLANDILHHELISSSTLSRIKRILPLPQTYKDYLSMAPAIRVEELVVIMRKLVEDDPAEGTPKLDEALKQRVKTLLDDADPQAAETIESLAGTLQTLAPDQTARAKEIAQEISNQVQRSAGDVRQAVGKLDMLFNTVMDRAAQRFTTHTRVWTIIFSFIVAFLLHLDAFQLLNQLASNPEIRASLVMATDTIIEQADDILKADVSGDPKARIELLKTQAETINTTLSNTGFHLVPKPYPGLFTYTGWRNIGGILFSAGLLSLGAPFWYNALKNLSNLRPLVANKQQKEQEKKAAA